MKGHSQIMQFRMHSYRGKLSAYRPHLISTPALADCSVAGGLAVSVGAAGALGGHGGGGGSSSKRDAGNPILNT